MYKNIILGTHFSPIVTLFFFSKKVLLISWLTWFFFCFWFFFLHRLLLMDTVYRKHSKTIDWFIIDHFRKSDFKKSKTSAFSVNSWNKPQHMKTQMTYLLNHSEKHIPYQNIYIILYLLYHINISNKFCSLFLFFFCFVHI